MLDIFKTTNKHSNVFESKKTLAKEIVKRQFLFLLSFGK